MAMTDGGVKNLTQREVAAMSIEVKFSVHEGHRCSKEQQAFGRFGGSNDNW